MSGKKFLTSKMEQNPSSCSIGIWNYPLALSKSKSRIFPGPYPSPLCSQGKFVFCAKKSMPKYQGPKSQVLKSHIPKSQVLNSQVPKCGTAQLGSVSLTLASTREKG